MLIKRKWNSSVSHSFLRACESQSLLLLVRDTAASCEATLAPAPSGFVLSNLEWELVLCAIVSCLTVVLDKYSWRQPLSEEWVPVKRHIPTFKMPEKSLQLSRALLESQILGGFSASELEVVSFQGSNSDWSYCCMNINGFDYPSRMSSLYMFEGTWLVASFPGSRSKFLLCSFFHTVHAVVMNILCIHHAQGNKPNLPVIQDFLMVVEVSISWR